MERKRKNIPAGVRWNVFQRDEFRCVYCGAAKKDGAVLVVDHGDPFSKGGADDESNYVTACKPCNDGKKAKIVIPPAAEVAGVPECVVRRGVAYRSHLHADWADALRQVCYSIEYWAASDEPETLHTVYGPDENNFSILRPDFFCDFLSEEVGKVNVVIAENCDIGCFGDRDKKRIRDAAILGYREPTAIIIGSPWLYWAVVINNRHKGCPDGFALDDSLDFAGDVCLAGWYPDEGWDFADPREDFDLRPRSFAGRGWHMTVAEAEQSVEMEVRHGL